MVGKRMKCNVVIPTCRNLDFLEKWKDTDLIDQHLIVVEDKKKPECKLPTGWDITRYTHKDINKELKKNAWIIAKGDGGIKSFGLLKSHQDKHCDFTVCLDDDVYPVKKTIYNSTEFFIQDHALKLFTETNNSNYLNVFDDEKIYTRGYPFIERKQKKVALNMGLWENVPDYDAITQFTNPETPTFNSFYKNSNSITVPKKCYTSICVMNVALRNESIPAYYQMLMGKKWNMYRFDDIWSGIMYKRIADHLDYAVTYGHPHVFHSRASNPFTNLWKESHGLERNEWMWKLIDSTEFNSDADTWEKCYNILGKNVEGHGNRRNDAYLTKLGEAMQIWSNLF